MISINRSIFILFSILLLSIISHYGFNQPFLLALGWSTLLLIVIILSVYLDRLKDKFLLVLKFIFTITSLFLLNSKIFGDYKLGLSNTALYIITTSRILKKTFLRK